MKYLGVDFGTKKIGLAVSNHEGTIAFPRGIIPNDQALVPQLVAMIDAEKIGTVVVGDTRALSGAANQASGAADAFIATLEKELTVPIERGREAWSSVEASRFAPKGHARNDAAAAAIILQRFLDMKSAK